MSIDERLMTIRTAMRDNGLDCCLIPSSDWHQSEYICEYFAFLKYLSGFLGSNGLLCILNDRSILWTDERYRLQAGKELESTEIGLMIYNNAESPPIIEWLCQNLRSEQVVGVDSRLFSLKWFLDTKKNLRLKKINLSDINNLLDSNFRNRTSFPCNPIDPLKKEYTGHTVEEKLTTLREKMREQHIQYYLVASLESIAWICNLRGSDMPYIPVFYSYFLLEEKIATLFVQTRALTAESKQSLKSSGIHIMEYSDIEDHFSHITLGVIFLSPQYVNAYICHILERNNKITMGEDLTINLKAVKHPAEIASSREAHRQDGAAMIRVLRTISETWDKGITEFQITTILEKERKKETLFRSLSFRAIAGHAGNGAIVHYAAQKKSSKIIKNGLTILDSGGQFLGATTDITRTFPTDELTEEECTDYTLTLKTHIALAQSLFVSGATGAQLDGIARHIMWTHAIDYQHGTGHGVGAMLCVHEGPQSLRGTNLVRFVPGMLITIEPGIYKEGKHGVRIENVYLIIEKVRNSQTFLAFECLTLCPIDTRPLRKELLTEEEIAWLNTYHQKVLKELSPRLINGDLTYLESTTRPI